MARAGYFFGNIFWLANASCKFAIKFHLLLFITVLLISASAKPALSQHSIKTPNDKTPNDVYDKVMLLKREVALLRKSYGITEKMPTAPTQTGKAPRHVLQKAMEVLDKINRLRRIKNMGEITIPPYPSRIITPNEVYDMVSRLSGEVYLFLPNTKFSQINKAIGKTPNHVYRQLWGISKAFDPLLGIKGLMPADVYNKSVEVLETVKFLRLTQNLPEQGVQLPKSSSGNHPNHSLKAVYKLLSKISIAEKNLWLMPVAGRKVPERVIEPQEVYDALNIVVAELQRVKHRIGVERHITTPHLKGSKTPDDVVFTIATAVALMPDFSKKPLIQYNPAFLQKTPNEVYSVATHILDELRSYKNYRGIKKPVRKIAAESGIEPKHVYQKTLENIEKVARLRNQLGIGNIITPAHPLRAITPAEVYELAIRLDSEMELIYKISGVKTSYPYYELTNQETLTGKTPSDVFQVMRQISYMLDTIIGSGGYTPSDVFINAKLVTDKLFLMAKRLGKVSKLSLMPKVDGKRPADVMKVIIEFSKLLQQAKKYAGMYGEYKPITGIGNSNRDVRPDDVYNSVGMILADIEELNTHLGINKHIAKVARVAGKTPSDVCQQIETAKNLLEKILK